MLVNLSHAKLTGKFYTSSFSTFANVSLIKEVGGSGTFRVENYSSMLQEPIFLELIGSPVLSAEGCFCIFENPVLMITSLSDMTLDTPDLFCWYKLN